MNRRTRRALVAVLVAVGLPPIAPWTPAPSRQLPHRSAASHSPPAVSPPLVTQSSTAINPQRLVDTRNNIGGWGTTVGAGCTMRVNLASDVPANAAAVSLSMTAISADADYFTVTPAQRPAGDVEPRHPAGHPTPNLVVAIPDVNREICIFSHATAHLIIDLRGGGRTVPTASRRSSRRACSTHAARRRTARPLRHT